MNNYSSDALPFIEGTITFQKFDDTRWGKWDRVSYNGGEWYVRSVNFKERLLGLVPDFLNPETDEYDTEWVRCENCALLENKPF
jgi:hypothetical protein